MNFKERTVFKKYMRSHSQVLFWIIFVALFTTFLLGRRSEFRVSHDFSSYLLPAYGESHGQGNVYLDYFINRPPMLFSLIKIWGTTFGWRYSTWVLLEILSLLIVSLGTYTLAKQFLHLVSARLFTLIFLSTLLFSDITSMFLTSEIIALGFIVLATVILIKAVDLNTRSLTISSALFTFSALIREQFAVVTICFIFGLSCVTLLHRPKFIAISQAIFGSGVVLFFTAVYLFVNQSFSSFFHIFLNTFKNEHVGLPQYRNWLLEVVPKLSDYFYFSAFAQHQLIITLFPIGIMSLGLRRHFGKDRKSLLSESNSINFFLLWIIGSSLLISTGWQSHGSRYTGHYALPSFVGLTLMSIVVLGFLRQVSNKIESRSSLKRLSYFVLIAAIFVSLLPGEQTVTTLSQSYTHISPSNFINRISNSDSEVLSAEEATALRIISTSPRDFKCSVNVYGWGTADFYYYTRSKPCSRFFLVNLITEVKDFEEYRKSLTENPPRIISYGCRRVNCSDLEYKDFEQAGFPFSNVLAACYHMIKSRNTDFEDEGLYLSNFNSRESQQRCIINADY